MSVIYHILKYKFLSFIKLNISINASSVLKNTGSFIVYSLFAVGAFFFSYNMIKYLLETMKIGLFLLHEFLSITLFIFFIAVNIGNIIVSYSTLYKSDEVNFLFHKPVAPSDIFIIKFFDNFFYSSSTLILILLSILAGYAYYLELSAWKVATLFLFNFVPFMLSAASLGIMILLIIVKLSTVIGARIVVSILALGYLSSLFIFFRTISPVDLVNQVMQYYPNIDLYFGYLLPRELKYLPNHWLSESLYWVARDNFTAAGKYFYLQIIISLSLVIIAIFLGMKWYHKTWFYSFRLRGENSKDDLDRIFSFKNNSILSSITESISKREYHLFMREPTQVFHLLILLFLITIFLSSVSSLTRLGGLNIFLQTVIYLSVFIFNTFMVATLSLRFVFPLVSLEGQTFWKIRSAPITLLKFMIKKITPYALIIISISFVLNIFVNLQFNFHFTVIMFFVNIIIAISIISMNFSAGALFANFNEKNPIRIASSQGASLSFLMNLIYMVLLIIIMYLPVQTFFDSLIRYGRINLGLLYNSFGIIFILGSAILIISHQLLKRSLKKDF